MINKLLRLTKLKPEENLRCKSSAQKQTHSISETKGRNCMMQERIANSWRSSKKAYKKDKFKTLKEKNNLRDNLSNNLFYEIRNSW